MHLNEAHMTKTKIVFLLAASLTLSLPARAQSVSCTDLLEFIQNEGYSQGSVSNYTMNSSWLYKVTAYSYDYKIYVVAEIKKNEYSIQTSTYIFCGIPQRNWTNFKNGAYGDSDSYGERFHKYIMDYQCPCN